MTLIKKLMSAGTTNQQKKLETHLNQADSLLEEDSSVMNGNPGVHADPPSCDTCDRQDSGYTIDSACENHDDATNTNEATGNLPSDSSLEVLLSSGRAPSRSRPRDTNFSNGSIPEDPERDPYIPLEGAAAADIAALDPIAATLTLTKDDDLDIMRDLQQLQEGEILPSADEDENSGTRDHSPHTQNLLSLEETNEPQLPPRNDDSDLSMPMAVGPPLNPPWLSREDQEAEYTSYLPPDMANFMEFRLATETETAAGNEERQSIQPVLRVNELSPEETHYNHRNNKPSADAGNTADQADSDSLRDGNLNAPAEPPRPTLDTDRQDSGYTMDSAHMNAATNTNVATGNLPSDFSPETLLSSAYAPSSNQPSDRPTNGSNGSLPEDPEVHPSVEIGDLGPNAAILTDDDDTDILRDLQAFLQQMQLSRVHNSGSSMPMALGSVGPPLQAYWWHREFVYTNSLPPDMAEFIDLRLATEADTAAGNDEREALQPVEDSLESWRQNFIEDLPEQRVVVNRKYLLDYILKLYDDHPNIHTTHKVYVRFRDDQGSFEAGNDALGMTRAMLSEVFRSLPGKFQYLPVIVSPGPPVGTCPLDCKCEVLAKLIFHGYVLTAQLPEFLPRDTVMRMFCSPAQFTDDFADLMITAFVNRQVPSVQAALKRAMDIGIQNDDMADICEFADYYGDGTPPPRDPSQFKKWLDSCVNQPNHFVAMFSRFREEKLGYSVPADVEQILETLSPTHDDILKLLKPAGSLDVPENRQAFEFLISFLDRCKTDLVKDFLQFCTGSDNLTMDEIKVQFYQGKGFPIASTCFDTVSIPTGYNRYEDFEERMIEGLENKDNYQFHRL